MSTTISDLIDEVAATPGVKASNAAKSEMPQLPLFEVNTNPDGWGPTTVPSQFLNRPYAPFNKSERLWKIADFVRGRYGNRWNDKRFDEDMDETFHIVDTGTVKPKGFKRFRRRRFTPNRWWNRNAQKKNVAEQSKKFKRQSGQSRFNRRRQQWKNRLYRPRDNRQYHVRQSSVKVQTDWKVVEQFELKELSNLSAPAPKTTEDVLWCGHLEYNDDRFDKTTTKSPVTLERITDRQFFYVSTTDDEVIEQLATDGKGNVFATDVILSHIMAAARSVDPWDIIVQRVGSGDNKTIFFDKREDQLDYLSVNETAYEPPSNEDKESINSAFNLSVEATTINQNFSQQVLKRGKERKDFDHKNPFFDPEEAEKGTQPAAVGYRYRRWALGDNIKLIARTELHSITKRKSKEVYTTCFALNEWDHKLAKTAEWRKKLDKQRGAVLASELKNNSCKLAKWTAQTILAGAELMKIGYISRTNRKDRSTHQILGTQYYKPTDFARQINLNLKNVWGIVRHLIEICMKEPEGKYLLMKDPNKPILRLYRLPAGTFDDSDDDE